MDKPIEYLIAWRHLQAAARPTWVRPLTWVAGVALIGGGIGALVWAQSTAAIAEEVAGGPAAELFVPASADLASLVGLIALALDRFGLPLADGMPGFEELPVAIKPLEVTLVGVSAMIIVWLSSLYPARVASRMRPVEALRKAEA